MSEMPALTQQRHRDNLIKCITCLKNYLEKTADLDSNNQDFALIAEELRMATKWIILKFYPFYLMINSISSVLLQFFID